MQLFKHSKKQLNNSILHLQKNRIDWSLFTVTLLICCLGILFIFEASSISALRIFGDKYHFIREQSIWLLLGLGTMIFFSWFDYHRLYNLSLPIIILAILLLTSVFIPGLGVKALGANRWLNLGFTTVQPAEATKLALIIYLSAWFTSKEKRRLLAFMILVGIVVGLVVLEPDLGTAIIIGVIAIVLYFLSSAPFWHFLMLTPIAVLGAIFLAIISPYRLKRLLTFFNPEIDPLGSSYHIKQILLALGSGGFWGLGLGKSRQKFEYLPEAMTDSIFAIIAEEVGFVGALVFICLMLFIIIRGFKIALSAPDRFGQLLAFGLIFWIGFQSIINLAAMVALIPLTGVPLPFISYGGSSLIMTLVGIGIILNISKQRLAKRR